MSGLLVDTSAWIEFFKGETLPPLEDALKSGNAFISPLVLSELISGKISAKQEKALLDFALDLNFVEEDTAHWIRVGQLRRHCLSKGLSVSTPDAHLAQSAMDMEGGLYSFDRIFEKMAKVTNLRVIA